MKRSWFGTAALAVLVVSWLGHAACGGDADELFGGATTSGAGGGRTGSGGSGSVSVGSGAQGGSSGQGGAASSSTSGSVSSSSGDGGSSIMASSSTGMMEPKLPCGDTECSLDAGEACCWDAYELHGRPQAECVESNGSGCQTRGGETLITCGGPADCPGAICCGDREFVGNQTFYVTVSCESSCDWPEIVICDINDPSFECPIIQTMQGPVQTQCQPSQILPAGYYVCGLP